MITSDHYWRIPIFLLFVLSVLGASRASAQGADPGWIPQAFVRTRPPTDSQAWNPDTVVFRNGQRLTAGLWAVEYVGQLPRGKKPPFLVLAAMGCYDCDDMTQIYLAWPGHGPRAGSLALVTDTKPYAYPGTVTPEETDTATFRSRFFIGRCLAENDEILVWYQDERDSTSRWVHEVYRVRVQNDSVVRGFLSPPLPTLEATLRRVHQGKCREVKPRDQVEY